MLELIKNPWHWSVAGLFVGLTVPLLLILGNKHFGISSSFRHICASCVPANISFFKYDWKKEIWNMFFVAGIVGGAWLAATFFADPNQIQVAESLRTDLAGYGITDYSQLVPADLVSWSALFSLRGLLMMVGGGLLVGFGTRYAGGCTSGHAIMGLSTLQWPSLVATISFMVGGFISARFLVPFILSL